MPAASHRITPARANPCPPTPASSTSVRRGSKPFVSVMVKLITPSSLVALMLRLRLLVELLFAVQRIKLGLLLSGAGLGFGDNLLVLGGPLRADAVDQFASDEAVADLFLAHLAGAIDVEG